MTTIYFTHCWGVFEGGGVRGSAHAGAFAAARSAGITFGRVAGTSAGSIVAALIAAGATPDYISDALEETDLSTFLSPACMKDSVFTESPSLLRVMRKFVPANWKPWLDAAVYSGLHSSRPIQDWVDQRLADILTAHGGRVGRPVTFRELPLPLHVVATNLSTGRAKVWSREDTPDESVAFAVRCSCSIPFFYQAINTQQGLLIDGGVVSNLPSFIYTNLMSSDAGRSVLSRVLAFRLVEDTVLSSQPTNILEYGMQLANASVSGSAEIQALLQPDVYDIPISTGAIKSTDFASVGTAEKRKLHLAGEVAVRRFVSAERATVRASAAPRSYRGFDEEMLLLVQGLKICNGLFVAVGASTYWLDFAFPMTLAAARRGVEMVCVTMISTSKDEMRRIALLKNLGVRIVLVEENELPFKGFVFDPDEAGGSIMLNTSQQAIRNDREYAQGIIRSYTREHDSSVMDVLFHGLRKHLMGGRVGVAKRLPYVEGIQSRFFDNLRCVSQYAKAKFTMQRLEISHDILVLLETVKEYKVIQIQQHVNDLQAGGCELFALKEIDFGGDSSSVITPPVLERLGDQLVVIEGNARLFHCLSNGIREAKVVIVDDVEACLPASNPRRLSTLRLASSTRAMTENYRQIDRSLFRHIEDKVHPYP